MARRQQNRAAQDSAVGRKILDRASKSVTSCNVYSPETKWGDSFNQSKRGKLYLAHRVFFPRRHAKTELECGIYVVYVEYIVASVGKSDVGEKI